MMNRKKYLVMFMIFLIMEIFIGLYAHGWLRYYGGDILIMPAMYFFVRIFTEKFRKSLPLILFPSLLINPEMAQPAGILT